MYYNPYYNSSKVGFLNTFWSVTCWYQSSEVDKVRDKVTREVGVSFTIRVDLRESAVFLIFPLSEIPPIRGTAEPSVGNTPSSFLLVLFVSFCSILFSTEAPTNLVAVLRQ